MSANIIEATLAGPRGPGITQADKDFFQAQVDLAQQYAEAAALAGYTVIAAVRVTTTQDIALSGEQTIDGIETADGDRVLVKDQADGADNGVYVVASGAWSRATDFDGAGEVVSGAYVTAIEGETQAGGWVLTTADPISVGTTALTWRVFRLDDYQRISRALAASDGAARVGFEGSTVAGALTCTPRNNLYLGSFMTGGSQSIAHLAMSADGSDFSKFNPRRWRYDTISFGVRDPSLTWFKGYFLMAGSNSQVDVRDSTVVRAPDALDWQPFDITFGGVPVCSSTTAAPGGSVPCEAVWAPEWYIDHDAEEAYLLFSLQTAPDAADADGRTVRFFRPYYSRLLDVESMSFAAPVAMDIPGDSGNKIDQAVVKLPDGTLMMVIKDEYDKKLEAYTATNLSGPWTFKNEMPFPRAEGACITTGPLGGHRIYVDVWELDHTYYCDTFDLFDTYTAPSPIRIDGKHRHGTVFNIGDHPPATQAEIVRRIATLAAWGKAPVRDGKFYLKPTTDRWNGTRLAPYVLRSGRHMSLAAVQALSGTITITVNLTEITSATIDLSTAASFADAAAMIQAGIGNPNVAVTWDDAAKRFILTATSPNTGKPRLSQAAAGTLATGLRLTTAAGAVLWGEHHITPLHNYCYYVQGDDQADVILDDAPVDAFFLQMRTTSDRAGIRLMHGAYYLSTNGVADYFGFGSDRDHVFEVVKDYNWDGGVRLETGVYRALGIRSGYLGYFRWDDRPNPALFPGAEMTSIDIGTTRADWVATSAGWISKHPVPIVRTAVATAKSDANDAVATLRSTTIRGGALGLNGSLRIWLKFNYPNSGTVKNLKVQFGGQDFWVVATTTTRTLTAVLTISNRNSEAAQIGSADATGGTGTTGSAVHRTGTVDTSVDQVLAVMASWGTAGDGSANIFLDEWRVELLP